MLDVTLAKLNRVRSRANLIGRLIDGVRAFVIGGALCGVWITLDPSAELASAGLGLIATVIAIVGSRPFRPTQPIGRDELLVSLEMRHPGVKPSALDLKKPGPKAVNAWRPILQQEVKNLGKLERRRLVAQATTIAIPILAFAVVFSKSESSFATAIKDVAKVVSSFNHGAYMQILSGATTESSGEKIYLSPRRPAEVELLSQNMIELTFLGYADRPPIVELRRPQGTSQKDEDEVFQSFQMIPVRSAESDRNEPAQFSISFAVTRNLEIFIPHLAASDPVAKISVYELPVPKVTLEANVGQQDPWPDDRPLPLNITAKGENPLATVRLLIASGQRISKELVNNIMTEDKFEVSTTYDLILESYLESDLAEVEIVAEVIDRALPKPLVGHSEPIRLTVASAYGRYRRTLATLNQVKGLLDEVIEKQMEKMPEQVGELIGQALEQSQDSPFFDALDRVAVHRFVRELEQLRGEIATEPLMDLSSDLNDFLFEHEILDDRERDRDFFVAVRGLSRVIEQDKRARQVDVPTVTSRIRNFLQDRQERWKLRVSRLPREKVPANWARIGQKKPFQAAMTRIDGYEAKFAGPSGDPRSLQQLSETVVEYRSWIEELEAIEDEARQQREAKRQEGLASARNTLRELQKRQGKISQTLDRADERPAEEIQNEWPSTRMKQNTNLQGTKGLEAQLRSLSPRAGARIRAAVESMEKTIEMGSQGKFPQAESYSDLAGRLLRQAQSDTQQSQKRRGGQRRRRRVTGDNYYGQSVVGGDIEIKREYQVDRRYREDILDEIRNANISEEHEAVLDNYLRRIVR